MNPTDAIDVIDQAAGLQTGGALHGARRFRAKVVDATQASHDALLLQPVAGLSVADRLRVAVQACEAAAAPGLAAHYRQMLQAHDQPASAALPAMQQFALALTTDPRSGDRAAIAALKGAGLDDPAIVALAQLVAFLSYQTRVVAGLKAMGAGAGAGAAGGTGVTGAAGVAGVAGVAETSGSTGAAR